MLSSTAFKKEIYRYYHANKRDFPWRTLADDPYAVLVSEIMLQQTQVDRVIPKYVEFLKAFPSVAALASASAADVLRAWQGLGYNRRALNLKRCAEEIIRHFNGKLPDDPELLESLPGIGPYTARAVCAFAFDKSYPFVETNIRSVYIHFFFAKASKVKVDDKKILKLVEETMDTEYPREWYSALMDYGTMLKKKEGNPNHRSKQYAKQSKFKGSNREIRGAILRMVARADEAVPVAAVMRLPFDEARLATNLEALEKEGFIIKRRSTIMLT